MLSPDGAPARMPDLAPLCERIAQAAHRALIDELETYPKPGLVSPVDAGSHRDMDAGTQIGRAHV